MPQALPQLILLALLAGTSVANDADDFALKDGDTVVFLGDSITAARTYGEIIENYTLLRFPERRVRFYNAGWGGDTAAGGAARLERDVFDRGATVVTVAFGTNDIGWGALADDEHQQKYFDGIRSIVTQCRQRGARVYICSAAVTAADPATSETTVLQTMCDKGMAIARELGGEAIDVQRGMRTIQRRVWAENERLKKDQNKTTMHAADGAHLNELGQLAMAFVILKGLGAPADVSAATIDFDTESAVEATGCRITEVTKADNDSLEFTRLDEGLPINFGLFSALNFRFVPVHSELSRYMLTVRNLPTGKYLLTVDEREISRYSNTKLAGGVNITFATTSAWQPGGPWDAQATSLRSLTEARSRLAVSELLWNAHLKGSSERPAIAEKAAAIDFELQQLQRTVARPMPYRFRLSRTESAQ
ncbi:MAG: hypothetical protein HQ518_08075 [Rhodopirellula sp.]|nr:hypothetical protein [Rhodopirellula sp.]